MATIMRNLGEIWRCGNLYRAEEYEAFGIGSYQDSYLIDICNHPGVTQEQLSRLMYVHKSNVARQVSSLEEKGFVERRPDPSDRRNLLLYPTEKALAVVGRLREAHRRWNEHVLAGFSEAECAAFTAYLERAAANARNVISKGGEGGGR